MPGETFVLGLDLSLRASAFVLLPATPRVSFAACDWGIAGVTLTQHADEAERDERCAHIGRELVRFLGGRKLAGAFVEGYAFGNAQRAHQLGELRGVVRFMLVDAGYEAPIPISSSAARKFFFGAVPKAPKKALKGLILEAVNGAGGTTIESDDVADALLIANYGRTSLDLPGITLLGCEPGERPLAIAKRSRKRTRE